WRKSTWAGADTRASGRRHDCGIRGRHRQCVAEVLKAADRNENETMKKYALAAICTLVCTYTQRLFGADSQWILESSTLTYHVFPPLHQSEGVSHAAKGKGVCHDGSCNIL